MKGGLCVHGKDSVPHTQGCGQQGLWRQRCMSIQTSELVAMHDALQHSVAGMAVYGLGSQLWLPSRSARMSGWEMREEQKCTLNVLNVERFGGWVEGQRAPPAERHGVYYFFLPSCAVYYFKRQGWVIRDVFIFKDR
eukprot:897335-Pelagomonas_calceolata.AAC.1